MSLPNGSARLFRLRRLPALLAPVLLTVAGCNTPLKPAHGSEEAIATATGVENAVVFRVEGGPLDEPAADAGAALTRIDAMSRALRTDPGLQAALARVRVAMADADQARLLPNPVLNIVLRWGPGKPQVEASLAGDFIQALQMPRRASAADHRLRQAAAEALTVALDVASGVEEVYTSAQSSGALSRVLTERLSLIERLGAVGKARLEAGEGTRGDVAMLDAERVELLVEIDSALLTEREERLRLARLIGTPSAAAVWNLDAWSAPSTGDATEAAWVEAGLRHRPEVQSVVWRMHALGDDAALATMLPWEGGSVGVDAQRDSAWFAGPSASSPLPVFDTGQAGSEKVTAQQAEARHDFTLARRKVVEEVRTAYATLAAGTAKLKRIQNQLIPLQQQRLQLAESGYRAGQSDVTALYLAEGDLRSAQTRAISAEQRVSTALVHLQRAVGGPGIAASLTNPLTPAPPAPLAPPAAGQPVSSIYPTH